MKKLININVLEKIQNNLKSNYKIILLILFSFFLLFIAFQIYIFNKNNQILKASIKYNNYIINQNKNENEIYEGIKDLSLEKNFYGILSKLNKINIYIDRKIDHEEIYNNYLEILKDKKVKEYYKSAIAIHASYSFLNILNTNLKNVNKIDIINKINQFLAFVNKDHLFYEGLKLEIMYLTAVLQHVNNQTEANLETTKLYELIQNNDKISSPLKQRVKIIHEFQKYK